MENNIVRDWLSKNATVLVTFLAVLCVALMVAIFAMAERHAESNRLSDDSVDYWRSQAQVEREKSDDWKYRYKQMEAKVIEARDGELSYGIHREVFVSGDWRKYSFRMESLTDDTMNQLKEIKGVTEVLTYPYAVSIERAKSYSWDEIEKQVVKMIGEDENNPYRKMAMRPGYAWSGTDWIPYPLSSGPCYKVVIYHDPTECCD